MKKTIEFTKLRFIMFAISAILIISGLVVTFVVNGGYNLGIDFNAGLNQQVQIDSSVFADIDSVRQSLSSINGAQIQVVGDPADQAYIIKVKEPADAANFQQTMSEEILTLLGKSYGAGMVEGLAAEYVGPRFSASLASQSIFLTAVALVLILVYIWFRFRLGYAFSAIAALIHDVLFIAAFIGALKLEVSTATIAAVLTIIGYSLNDTIVIFDRIRENEVLLKERAFTGVVNVSITQSLSRTLITSITTLLAVIAIYVFGTGSIQTFALNLIVGVVVGTYSSIFIASPVLLGIRHFFHKEKEVAKLEREAVQPVEEEPTPETESTDVSEQGEPGESQIVQNKPKQSRSKRKRSGRK